jgi:4-amino-4-deoxy-L-arabinose transferase-like glycosyltransferase
MDLEPAPRRPTLRQAAVALVTIIALIATAGILGWVSLANLLDHLLTELLTLALASVFLAYGYKSK